MGWVLDGGGDMSLGLGWPKKPHHVLGTPEVSSKATHCPPAPQDSCWQSGLCGFFPGCLSSPAG